MGVKGIFPGDRLGVAIILLLAVAALLVALWPVGGDEPPAVRPTPFQSTVPTRQPAADTVNRATPKRAKEHKKATRNTPRKAGKKAGPKETKPAKPVRRPLDEEIPATY